MWGLETAVCVQRDRQIVYKCHYQLISLIRTLFEAHIVNACDKF